MPRPHRWQTAPCEGDDLTSALGPQAHRGCHRKDLHSNNHLHLRGVHRCNCCFNLRIEVRFDITGIQFNDESEAHRLSADVLGRLRLPPTCNWVDCKHVSLGEIRGGAPQLIDVQTPHVASVGQHRSVSGRRSGRCADVVGGGLICDLCLADACRPGMSRRATLRLTSAEMSPKATS